MTRVMKAYTSGTTDDQLAPAVAGTRIVVRRVLHVANGSGTFALNTKQGSEPGLPILGDVHYMSQLPIDVDLGERYAIATGTGEALTATTTISAAQPKQTLVVWFERVPA